MSEAAFARVSLVDARAPVSGFYPLRPRLVTGATPPEACVVTDTPDLFALGFAAGQQAAGDAFETERRRWVVSSLQSTRFSPNPPKNSRR